MRVALMLDYLRTDAFRLGHDFGDAPFQQAASLLEIARLTMVRRMHSDDAAKLRQRPSSLSLIPTTTSEVMSSVALAVASESESVTLPTEQLRQLLTDVVMLHKLVATQ